jgi:hypothetical protein
VSEQLQGALIAATAGIAAALPTSYLTWHVERRKSLYDAGGLTAEASTRAAIVHLRSMLAARADCGTLPDDIVTWGDRVLVLLRRDMDLGSPQVLANSDENLLGQVGKEADRLLRGSRSGQREK